MTMEQCCGSQWGLSWRNASGHTCLSCTYTLLPGTEMGTHMHIYTKVHFNALLCLIDGLLTLFRTPPDSPFSPLVRGGLFSSARTPQGSATCMSWGGSHYRTFDKKHFHFQGSCTYLLASSTDGTWAVYISTVCATAGDCSKV